MSVTRRDVLEQLDGRSDADAEEWTSVEALADALVLDERTLWDHLDGLTACELAHVAPDGDLRITVTGEELLALDLDETIVVDPETADGG
jgi:hypothetical protein